MFPVDDLVFLGRFWFFKFHFWKIIFSKKKTRSTEPKNDIVQKNLYWDVKIFGKQTFLGCWVRNPFYRDFLSLLFFKFPAGLGSKGCPPTSNFCLEGTNCAGRVLKLGSRDFSGMDLDLQSLSFSGDWPWYFCGEGWPGAWGYGKVEIYFPTQKQKLSSKNQFGNDNIIYFIAMWIHLTYYTHTYTIYTYHTGSSSTAFSLHFSQSE